MPPRLRFLVDTLIDRILDEAVALLTSHGARVDDRGRVQLPPAVVDAALQTAPSAVRLFRDGHLLIADHTRRHLREQIHLPGPVIERASLGRWREEGETTLGARATSEVDRLVATWTPSRIPEEAKEALRERMRAAASAAGLDALPPVEA